MAILQKTHLYEVLIRFGADGFQGAHQRDLTLVQDEISGQVFSESEGPAMPLSREAIADLMDAQIVPMAQQIVDLFFERDRLATQNAALLVEVEALKKAIPAPDEYLPTYEV